MRRYITAGQDVLDRLCLLLHSRKLLGKAFDSITEQPSLGDGASRKRALSTSFISARLSQRWRSWTSMVDNRLPEGPRHDLRCPRARSVAVLSSCIKPGSALPSCICLRALAWCSCWIAVACRAEAAWPKAL